MLGNPDAVPVKPGQRRYNRLGGRPPLNVGFRAVCDAVQGAWNGSGETITEVAERFGISRGWLHKWVYPALYRGDERKDRVSAHCRLQASHPRGMESCKREWQWEVILVLNVYKRLHYEGGAIE